MTKRIEDIKYNKKKITVDPTETKAFVNFPNNKIDEKIVVRSQIERKIIKQKNFFNFKIQNKNKILKPLIFIILLMGLLFFVFLNFKNATLIIKEKRQSINIENKKITTSKESNSTLDFEIMVLSEVKNKEIILTQKEEVSLKAKGEIILYNEYSNLPHKITKDKILSDENGKSYKLKGETIIPGYKIDQDGKINPGIVEVEAEAFLPGDVYNGEPKKFVINDYKDTDKYEKIYAEAKSSFEGGALGLVYQITENDSNQLLDYFEKDFKSLLLEKAKAETPDGYIFYPESAFFSFNYDKDKLYKMDKPEVEIIGIITVPLFNRNNLSNYIKKEFILEASNKELKQLELLNMDNLVFSYFEDNQFIDKEIKVFVFKLNGQLEVMWHSDIEEIKNKLPGIEKSKTIETLNDKSIDQLKIKVFPPWLKYFPNDTSKIKVIISN